MGHLFVLSWIKSAKAMEEVSFILLLVFTPLASGATARWAFCISLWLALAASTAMILKRLWQGQSPLPRTTLEAPLVLLLLMVPISLYTSIYRQATVWALLRLLLYVSIFYVTLDLTVSRRRTKRLVLTLLAMGSLITMLGFVKYAGGPFPSFWVYSGTGAASDMTSTFVNHNHLAGYLEMIFALGLGLFLQRPLLHPLLLAAILTLVLAALFLTMSRGAWIAAFLSSSFMLFVHGLKRKPGRWKMGIMVFAFVIVAGLSFLGSNTMIERLESLRGPGGEPSIALIRYPVWSGCLELIRDNPWWGSGLGTFPWAFTQVRPKGLPWRFREAHNDYLQIVSEMGLTVLLPLFWGLCAIFTTAAQKLKEHREQLVAGITLGALGGIIALLVHSISDFNIQITSNGTLFSLLVGLVMADHEAWIRQQLSTNENLGTR